MDRESNTWVIHYKESYKEAFVKLQILLNLQDLLHESRN